EYLEHQRKAGVLFGIIDLSDDVQPFSTPDLEDLSFFMNEHLVLECWLQNAARDPADIAFCNAFSSHRIGLGHFAERGGPLLYPGNDRIAQRIGNAVPEDGSVDEDLADMVELVGCLAQHLDEEAVSAGAVGTIYLFFLSLIGEAVGQTVEGAGPAYNDGIDPESFLQDLFGIQDRVVRFLQIGLHLRNGDRLRHNAFPRQQQETQS